MQTVVGLTCFAMKDSYRAWEGGESHGLLTRYIICTRIGKLILRVLSMPTWNARGT